MVNEVIKLQADPLFLALTRPAMLLGVTYAWFSVNGLVWALYFINYSNFAVMIPGAVIVHFIGFMLCSHEPRFMDLFFVALRTNLKCSNRLFHNNTSSYDLY